MEIIERVNTWAKNRTISMFEIPCFNKIEAIGIQDNLRNNGYIGYVTTMGKNISVILYLSDIRMLCV